MVEASTGSEGFIDRQNEFVKPGQKEMFEGLKKFYFPMGGFARFLESVPSELRDDAKQEVISHLESVVAMIKAGTFEEKA